MTNLRLTQAKRILQQAKALREQIQEYIQKQNWSCDDVCLQTYNDLIEAAANLIPEDPILNGQMIRMPDAYMQTVGGAYLIQFPDTTSQRTKQRLARLINRLEMLCGEEPGQKPVDERDYSFIADNNLRAILILDYIEAQKAFNAEAYKACGLLCGGLIEGMLLDIVQKRKGQSIGLDRVSMTELIRMSGDLGLISSPVLKFAEGARDVRDTVHPRAEVRQGHRVLEDEAEILLQLVKLIYNDLVAEFGKS